MNSPRPYRLERQTPSLTLNGISFVFDHMSLNTSVVVTVTDGFTGDAEAIGVEMIQERARKFWRYLVAKGAQRADKINPIGWPKDYNFSHFRDMTVRERCAATIQSTLAHASLVAESGADVSGELNTIKSRIAAIAAIDLREAGVI